MSQPLGLRSRRSLAIALATTLSTALGTTLGTPLSISALPAAALATPLTRLELADTDVINQELRTDPVRVIVNYDRDEAGWTNSLGYQIFYNDLLKVEDSQETSFQSTISLQDLDQNGTAEVITETYSGGAHCCTTHTVYSWQEGDFVKTDLGFRDGGGGRFEEINGDERLEFVSYDNAFLYAFSSYAGSSPPSQIFSFQNGRFVNTTRQYPQYLRSTAWQMYQSLLRSNQNTGEVNGILAGYVAQKILLGEYQQGWDFMLAHYDRQSDWGLEITAGDRAVGYYSDFPAALRAFLIEQGYLTRQGQPTR